MRRTGEWAIAHHTMKCQTTAVDFRLDHCQSPLSLAFAHAHAGIITRWENETTAAAF